MRSGLTRGRTLLLICFSAAQNSVWVTAFGWMATYLVNSGITGSRDYLLISLVPAWGTLIGLISQPIYAAITDLSQLRWGRRRPFIFIGGLFASLWFILIPLLPLYSWVFILYGLCSLSLNLAEVSYMAFFRDKVTLRGRGMVSGAMLTLSLVSTLPLATGIIGYEMLHLPQFLVMPFMLGGGLAAMLTLPTTLALRDKPAVTTTSFGERLRSTLAGLREFTSNPDLRKICMIQLLYNLTSGMVIPFALLYLEQEIGIPTDIGGLLHSLILLVTFIFCIPLGIYADRRGRRPLLAFASTCILVSMIMLFVNGLTLRSFPAAMAAFGLMGMAFTTFDFVPRAYVADIAPEGKEAQYFATANIFATIPFPIGILFGGFTSEFYSCLRYLPLLTALMTVLLLLYVAIMRETVVEQGKEGPEGGRD